MSLALLKEYCPEYSRKTTFQAMNFVERKAQYTNHINEIIYPYTLDGSSYYSFDNEYYKSLAADSSEGLRESVFDGIATRFRAISTINTWLGTPYKYAGRSRKGIDCSNFTSVILSEFIGKRFPAGADVQSKMFEPIRKIEDLQFGDIMFFSSSAHSNGRIGHSAIYIGNGLFAHSSSYKKRGVIYQHITDSKYSERFQFGGRLLKSRWLPAI
jgi:cell wall-associated NlpC family hydrolase